MVTFPPTLPAQLQDKLVIEEVDTDTIRIKLVDGTVVQTLTKTEYENAFQAPVQAQG